MESILGVDLTKNPAQAVLVRIEGDVLTILSQKQINFGEAFSKDALLGISQNGHNQTSESQEADSESPPLQINYDLPDDARAQIKELPGPWDRVAVVAPAHDLLALNISLPFADQKNISKILGLEVQDRVPFEIDDLLLQHSVVGPDADSGHDVYVSGISKKWIENTIRTCRKLELEPAIITTPGSLISSLRLICDQTFDGFALFVIRAGNNIHLVIAKDGMPLGERVVALEPQASTGSKIEISSDVAAELKIAASSLEKRLGSESTAVYMLTSEEDCIEIGVALGRIGKTLKVNTKANNISTDSEFAVLSALLAKEEAAPPTLTNFRSGEFAYSPKLRELLRAVRVLTPHFLLCLLAGTVFLAGLYTYRNYAIKSIREGMREQIRRVIPSVSGELGSEIQEVTAAKVAIDQELKALGAPAKITPLDALIEISKDFKGRSGISVGALSIKEGRVTLDVTTPDYADANKLERDLGAKRDKNCNVKKSELGAAMSGAAGSKSFKFEISLCP